MVKFIIKISNLLESFLNICVFYNYPIILSLYLENSIMKSCSLSGGADTGCMLILVSISESKMASNWIEMNVFKRYGVMVFFPSNCRYFAERDAAAAQQVLSDSLHPKCR